MFRTERTGRGGTHDGRGPSRVAAMGARRDRRASSSDCPCRRFRRGPGEGAPRMTAERLPPTVGAAGSAAVHLKGHPHDPNSPSPADRSRHRTPHEGPPRMTATRLLRTTARIALPAIPLLAAAYAAPVLSTYGPLRNRVMPRLAGRGREDHVALTFDDGPDPLSTPSSCGCSTSAGCTRPSSSSAARRYAPRAWCARWPPRDTRSPSTVGCTARCCCAAPVPRTTTWPAPATRSATSPDARPTSFARPTA